VIIRPYLLMVGNHLDRHRNWTYLDHAVTEARRMTAAGHSVSVWKRSGPNYVRVWPRRLF
jgi:hypothetical protein